MLPSLLAKDIQTGLKQFLVSAFEPADTHCFARYANHCNVYVRSWKADVRVMELLRKCYAKLRLKVKEAKSAVASVTGRKFLGYCFWFAKKERPKAKRGGLSADTNSHPH